MNVSRDWFDGPRDRRADRAGAGVEDDLVAAAARHDERVFNREGRGRDHAVRGHHDAIKLEPRERAAIHRPARVATHAVGGGGAAGFGGSTRTILAIA